MHFSHTRPVCHLDFSDITECGSSFLLSACKGTSRPQWGKLITQFGGRSVYFRIILLCVCHAFGKVLEIQFFFLFFSLTAVSLLNAHISIMSRVLGNDNLRFRLILFLRRQADAETRRHRRLDRHVRRPQGSGLGRRSEQDGDTRSFR